MSAQEARETVSDQDSAMEINGQAVHTRVVDAIAVASTSLFLARTNEPDPIAEKVKRITNDGIKSKRNPKAIADDIRKLVRGAMWIGTNAIISSANTERSTRLSFLPIYKGEQL